MELLISLIKAFVCGGALCLIGQYLIDKTPLTPAKILTVYVVAGVVLGAVGVYEPFAKWAGAGASVPLTGFGANLAKGVRKAIEQDGVIGILSGGLTAAAAGLSAAIFFGWLAGVFGKSQDKA